jgi:hypothetical protein
VNCLFIVRRIHEVLPLVFIDILIIIRATLGTLEEFSEARAIRFICIFLDINDTRETAQLGGKIPIFTLLPFPGDFLGNVPADLAISNRDVRVPHLSQKGKILGILSQDDHWSLSFLAADM